MGLNVLTTTFAQEYGPKVRVNTVMPGPFHTDGTSAWSRGDAFTQHAQRNLPLQRGGEPPEIVGAVLFLVSELASFTTGRSEEHTSELQSLMRISYAVFCLKKKNKR